MSRGVECHALGLVRALGSPSLRVLSGLAVGDLRLMAQAAQAGMIRDLHEQGNTI